MKTPEEYYNDFMSPKNKTVPLKEEFMEVIKQAQEEAENKAYTKYRDAFNTELDKIKAATVEFAKEEFNRGFNEGMKNVGKQREAIEQARQNLPPKV